MFDMAVPNDMYLATILSGESGEEPPRVVRLEPETPAVHEGDSCVYTQLAKTAWQLSELLGFRQEAHREKVDAAYVAYAITLDQWASLYNILNGREPDTPIIEEPPHRDEL